MGHKNCNGCVEIEMKEKMDRVDDAISATRAAIKMGVVPGGGSTLIHIAKDMRMHLQDSKHHLQ